MRESYRVTLVRYEKFVQKDAQLPSMVWVLGYYDSHSAAMAAIDADKERERDFAPEHRRWNQFTIPVITVLTHPEGDM